MMWRPISVLLLGLTLVACGEKAAQQPATAPAGAQQPAPVTAATPAQPAEPVQDAPPTEDAGRGLSLANKPWKGDFDAMLERKTIRVLVPYSRTLYFLDKGQERGLTAETVRDFETYINKKYRKDKRPITVFIIPTTRDKLIDDVAAGIGDIAAGNITVTPSREKIVDFYAPDNQPTHDEIVVTGPNAPPLATLDDLAGKAVAVRKSSSHYESLVALNKRFAAATKPPVQIELLPDALETPDILEMADAGVLDIVIADSIEAKAWALALPNIKVREDLAVTSATKIGWAIRKNSPRLAAALEDFRENHLVKQGVTAYRLAQFQKRFKRMGNPAQSAEYKRFQDTLEIFRRYGPEYDFDPVMLAAQGFQESRLNQDAKSHVGAIGVMQIMPATGKELECRRHPQDRGEHPRWRQVPRQADARLLQGCEIRRAEPRAVRVRLLQRRARAHPADAQDRRRTRAGPRRLVQQRRDRHRRQGRHGDDDLRAQHLQVLRLLPAAAGPGGAEAAGRGVAGALTRGEVSG